MSINVFVNFNGNCRDAVEFYAEVFDNQQPQIMSFKDAPQNPDHPPLPEEAQNLVMFSSLKISGSDIMFSDTFPGMPFNVGNNISLTVVDEDVEKLKTYFNKIKIGGAVEMDLQETFWSKCYGMVIDKFGIPWQFSHAGKERY